MNNSQKLEDVLFTCLSTPQAENSEEFLEDATNYLNRQRVLNQVLRGENSVEDVADLLNDQGFLPELWIENSLDNLENLCQILFLYPSLLELP